MKTKPSRKSQEGYALATVLVVGAVSIALYASMAQWAANGSRMTDRNIVYNDTVAAAEGATEKVLTCIERDFANQSYNPNQLGSYSALVPTNDWAGAYQFGDGAGNVNQTFVSSSTVAVMTNLSDQFAGLYGLAYNCAIRATAAPVGTPYNLAAAVEQDFQLASIPVFQFAIFYGLDLEIEPGPAMTINGKVHSNQNL